MKIGVIPGSFDPVTLGHIDLIERGAKMFDQVFAVAMINDKKQYTFTLSEREGFLKQALSHIENCCAESYGGMLVDYVKEKGAVAIIKGVRSETDIGYELYMAHLNNDLGRGADTVLICAQSSLAGISSSMVKEKAGTGGSVAEYVPQAVALALEKLKEYKV